MEFSLPLPLGSFEYYLNKIDFQSGGWRLVEQVSVVMGYCTPWSHTAPTVDSLYYWRQYVVGGVGVVAIVTSDGTGILVLNRGLLKKINPLGIGRVSITIAKKCLTFILKILTDRHIQEHFSAYNFNFSNIFTCQNKNPVMV